VSTNPPTGTLPTSMAPGGMQARLPMEHPKLSNPLELANC